MTSSSSPPFPSILLIQLIHFYIHFYISCTFCFLVALIRKCVLRCVLFFSKRTRIARPVSITEHYRLTQLQNRRVLRVECWGRQAELGLIWGAPCLCGLLAKFTWPRHDLAVIYLQGGTKLIVERALGYNISEAAPTFKPRGWKVASYRPRHYISLGQMTDKLDALIQKDGRSLTEYFSGFAVVDCCCQTAVADIFAALGCRRAGTLRRLHQPRQEMMAEVGKWGHLLNVCLQRLTPVVCRYLAA